MTTLRNGLLRLLLTAAAMAGAAASETLVRYPAGSFAGDFRYAYPLRVLQLALDRTAEESGPARAVQATLPMGTARIAVELERRELLDVATFPASRELLTRFAAAPICIRKGILGIRLLLIDRRRQHLFDGIRDLAGLKQRTLGQGFDWLDASILAGNGLQVVPSTTYEGLFPMLMSGRFDGFPRGLYEPLPEIRRHGGEFPDLAIEPRLALLYPLPDYFFVAKDNQALAQRLTLGLERAIADGSFEALFQESFAEDIRQAGIGQRTVIRLGNPHLDAIPHAGDPRYWFMP